MKILSHNHHQNINVGDVMTRDTPRDLMTTNGIDLLNDSFLQTMSPFYDFTDTASQLLPWDHPWIHSANDSGVFLNQSDDQWSPHYIATDTSTSYDVTLENTIASSAESPRCDVFDHVTVESPGVWSSEFPSADVILENSTRYDVDHKRLNMDSPSVVWPRSPRIPSSDVITDHVTAAKHPCWSGIPSDEKAAVCQCSPWSFTDDQVRCICVALQQKRDVDKLEVFLSQLQTCQRHCRLLHGGQETNTSSRGTRLIRHQYHSAETSMNDAVNETSADVVDAVLSSVAQVSYARGHYDELYSVLESHTFNHDYHASLQHLWYEAHYAEESVVRRRPLSAVDKHRVRRRHPLPSTIWDGEQTLYCFKLGVRNLLKESYDRCRYPTPADRRHLAQRTGLTVTQVNNWYKNRRQRDIARNCRHDTRDCSLTSASSSASSASAAAVTSSVTSHMHPAQWLHCLTDYDCV